MTFFIVAMLEEPDMVLTRAGQTCGYVDGLCLGSMGPECRPAWPVFIILKPIFFT